MNKKGFTLVELLAVIAILAILVLVAVPNVLSMFNKAKKDSFLNDARNIYKEVTKKYITESMRGNNINVISNDNNKLDMDTNDLKYNVKLDSKGNIKSFEVSNDTYCISGKFNNLGELTIDKVKEGVCETVTLTLFEEDSWSEIISNVKNGKNNRYNVGDTKEIELSGYGKFKIRVSNNSTPDVCNTFGFSQTACGFVLEFEGVIATHEMNPGGEYNGKTYNLGYNTGGWPATSMRTFLNSDIYNALPTDLRNGIVDTLVTSGHGTEDSDNFTSTDKLYLLAPAEIWEDTSVYTDMDSAKDLSRQLDYYKLKGTTLENNSFAKKNDASGNYSSYWLRSPYSAVNMFFLREVGGSCEFFTAKTPLGVSPAFRIG